MNSKEIIYYMFRHGETNWNAMQKDATLSDASKEKFTEIGKRQIKDLSNKLNIIGVQAIFTSDIVRTELTSKMANANNNLNIYYLKELRELDTGIYKDMPKKDFLEQEPIIKAFKNHDYIIPSGESINELIARSYNALNTIRDSYNYNKVAIISHCSVIANLKSDLLNEPYEDIDYCFIKYSNNKYEVLEYGKYNVK